MALQNKYAIVGVGQSAIGEVPGSSALGLLTVAMKNAIEDAGLRKDEVDGLISRGPDDVYCHHQRMGEALGLDVRFSTSLDSGGASQCLAVIMAMQAIDAGLCHTVVTGYGRNSWSRTRESAASRKGADVVPLVPEAQMGTEFRNEFGLFGAVSIHGFGARRHMHLYGTTREQLGHVAVTFRRHALRNPHAQMKRPLTMEEYLSARLIVDPFGLYDCSLNSDGAGAVVVTAAERARSLKRRPIYIMGYGTANNLKGWFADDNMVVTAAKRSGEAAYRIAGITHKDVDTAQLYDCFTYMVLAELEEYGFCAKGEGGPFVASGALDMDGVIPTNTSGGQLSEGHVEGMLQILEGVRQLRGELPPERQVKNAEIALISGHGGNAACHSTLILRR
ncbi:MAG: thiolase family protein [Chloroflexi bacterium]|nr:thiolase family protein [Chloroflexota bacterium]